MSLNLSRSRRWMLLGLVQAICLAARPGDAHAQGRPSGNAPRLWMEVGVAAASQAHRCLTCGESATVGGGSATLAGGVTLPRSFGVGLLARAFNQFDLESSSLQSRYVVAFGQYTPPVVSFLTLNVGGGQGRHSSGASPPTSVGSGTVLYAGVALRLPPRSKIALSLTGDMLQSIDGTPRTHPRLMGIGIALGAATRSLAP